MMRKDTPLHRYWHRRVDGQIINCINAHPEWFRFKNKMDRKHMINSLAKRIVGEIVAASRVANDEVSHGVYCEARTECSDSFAVLLPKDRMSRQCSIPWLFRGILCREPNGKVRDDV